MKASIIICTCNRAKNLAETLRRLNGVSIPSGFDVEVLVVDNASKDNTAEVVHASNLQNMDLRYLHEPKAGKCNAYNAGLAAARGEALLFTDDDVRPAPDWVVQLATPLLHRECDAVVGQIRLAEHLERPWMTPMHKMWLAAPSVEGKVELPLIGANMGFHRSVLERVPAFDPELGPGALGFGDELLLSCQLREGGYHLRVVPNALVVHHFDYSRLLRSHWLVDARKRGAVSAYLLHHWHHAEFKNPRMRACYFAGKLRLRRALHRTHSLDEEGCPAWEISYLTSMETFRQFAKERWRPRNYAKRGLVRLDWPIRKEPSATDRGIPKALAS